MKKKLLRWTGNVLLLSVSCGIAFAISEVLARVFLSTPPRMVLLSKDPLLRQRLKQENDNPKVRERAEHTDYVDGVYIDTITGRRLRANTHLKIYDHSLSGRDIEIHTNSLGYRNREIGPKTLTRALFLGDSITIAGYADEHETIVRQIEELSWKTKFPLETINTGVAGASLTSELAILEETGLSTHPDIVVVGFYLNDFRESIAFKFGNLPGIFDQSYFLHSLLKTIYFLIFDHFNRQLPFLNLKDSIYYDEQGDNVAIWKKDIQQQFLSKSPPPQLDNEQFYKKVLGAARDWGSAWSESGWKSMEPVFQRYKQLSAQHGFELRFVIFPVIYQVTHTSLEDYPQSQIKKILSSLGIPVLDLLPFLREVYPISQERLFYDHCHLTPIGNHLVAKEILRFLQETSTIQSTTQIPETLLANSNIRNPKFSSKEMFYIGLAHNYLQQKDYSQALKNFERAIQLSPDPKTFNDRGIVFIHLKKFEKALDDFTQAIRLDSNLAKAYQNRGYVLSLLKAPVQQICADFEKGCTLGICNSSLKAIQQQYCKK